MSNYSVELVSGTHVAAALAEPKAFGYELVEGREVNDAPLLVQRTDDGAGAVTIVYAVAVSDDEAILVGSRWAADDELLEVVDALGASL